MKRTFYFTRGSPESHRKQFEGYPLCALDRMGCFVKRRYPPVVHFRIYFNLHPILFWDNKLDIKGFRAVFASGRIVFALRLGSVYCEGIIEWKGDIVCRRARCGRRGRRGRRDTRHRDPRQARIVPGAHSAARPPTAIRLLYFKHSITLADIKGFPRSTYYTSFLRFVVF